VLNSRAVAPAEIRRLENMDPGIDVANTPAHFHSTFFRFYSTYCDADIIDAVNVSNGTWGHVANSCRLMQSRVSSSSAPDNVLVVVHCRTKADRITDVSYNNPCCLSLLYWLDSATRLISTNISARHFQLLLWVEKRL
jgi:hypothetical protein